MGVELLVGTISSILRHPDVSVAGFTQMHRGAGLCMRHIVRRRCPVPHCTQILRIYILQRICRIAFGCMNY